VQEIGAGARTRPTTSCSSICNELCVPDQPIGRSILGTPEDRALVRRDKLRGYLARNYRAPDMVVAAAGAVDHKRVVEEVERRFASFTARRRRNRSRRCSAAARIECIATSSRCI
jgi:predicted Zn-dependent peptidase